MIAYVSIHHIPAADTAVNALAVVVIVVIVDTEQVPRFVYYRFAVNSKARLACGSFRKELVPEEHIEIGFIIVVVSRGFGVVFVSECPPEICVIEIDGSGVNEIYTVDISVVIGIVVGIIDLRIEVFKRAFYNLVFG